MSAMEIKFWDFHYKNPHVLEALRSILRRVRSAGKQQYGVAAMFERLRWISEFETVGDFYKLNNNHRSFYTRLIDREPEFAGMLQKRRSAADRLIKQAA